MPMTMIASIKHLPRLSTAFKGRVTNPNLTKIELSIVNFYCSAPKRSRLLTTGTTTRSTLASLTPTNRNHQQPKRTFTKNTQNQKENDDNNNNNATNTVKSPEIIYEGPFAKLSLRLKYISLTTALLGLIGVPLVIATKSAEGVAVAAQLAVGGTAASAGVGSTLALAYCFSPYVHTLERVNMTLEDGTEEQQQQQQQQEGDSSEVDDGKMLIRATTRDILSRRVVTTFDPDVDIEPALSHRPFCNFVAKGVPMYVHPDLILDEEVHSQIFGKVDDVKKEEADGDDSLF